MTRQNKRSFRPEIEASEPRIYLSGAHGRAAALPNSGLIDLKPTALINDLRNSLIRTTPHDGRQGWALRLLKVDPTSRLVYGGLSLLYRAKTLPGFLSSYNSRQKIKVDIAFITPLDAPKVSDVKVAVSHQNPNFGPNVRREMAVGVVDFLKSDHDLIAASLPPSTTG